MAEPRGVRPQGGSDPDAIRELSSLLQGARTPFDRLMNWRAPSVRATAAHFVDAASRRGEDVDLGDSPSGVILATRRV
jgi:hypothetical protein